MSYIITQCEETGFKRLQDVEVMSDPVTDKVYTFESYEEAASYLMCYGLRPTRDNYIHNIEIVMLQ